MDDLEGIIQAWKNAREQETSAHIPTIRYVEAPSTTIVRVDNEPETNPIILDPMPTIMPMLFRTNQPKMSQAPMATPLEHNVVDQSAEHNAVSEAQTLIVPEQPAPPETPPPIVKVEAAPPEPAVTTELDHNVDVQQTATIVRVANRQRSDAGSSNLLEKAKKKREKQQILLYGRFYKCKLQIKELQREILVACEKHNELLSQLASLAKRANIPSDEMAVDSYQVTKRIQMIHSACIKQEPKVRRLRTASRDAGAPDASSSR